MIIFRIFSLRKVPRYRRRKAARMLTNLSLKRDPEARRLVYLVCCTCFLFGIVATLFVQRYW